MRNQFVATLTEMAREDDRVVLLTADLGWSVLDVFASTFPRRFVNVGVAEQNLAGIAAGFAGGLCPLYLFDRQFCHHALL